MNHAWRLQDFIWFGRSVTRPSAIPILPEFHLSPKKERWNIRSNRPPNSFWESYSLALWLSLGKDSGAVVTVKNGRDPFSKVGLVLATSMTLDKITRTIYNPVHWNLWFSISLILTVPEGVEAGALGGVPDPDGLVLRVGEDEVLPRVEDHARHVVVVATAGVHLPSLKTQRFT